MRKYDIKCLRLMLRKRHQFNECINEKTLLEESIKAGCSIPLRSICFDNKTNFDGSENIKNIDFSSPFYEGMTNINVHNKNRNYNYTIIVIIMIILLFFI